MGRTRQPSKGHAAEDPGAPQLCRHGGSDCSKPSLWERLQNTEVMLEQEEMLRLTAAFQGCAVLLHAGNKNEIKPVLGQGLSLEVIPDSCSELPDVPNPLG